MLYLCKNIPSGKAVSILLPLLVVVFGFTMREQGPAQWLQQQIAVSFDPDAGDTKLKKFDLQITPEGFFRLKKYYPNGKQEYFSFHIKRLADMNYLGNTSYGVLLLQTGHADIIVQTYNDRKGNIDSMATVLELPVRNMEPARLDSLRETFGKFK